MEQEANIEIKKETPAEKLVRLAGGQLRLAELLELDPAWVCRWLKPKSKLATGGAIPRQHYKKILQISKRRGWKIKPIDLIS